MGFGNNLVPLDVLLSLARGYRMSDVERYQQKESWVDGQCQLSGGRTSLQWKNQFHAQWAGRLLPDVRR